MFKMALFDCAVNEKCCSVDRVWSSCLFFSSPPWGNWQLEGPHLRGIFHPRQKKLLMPGDQPGRGGVCAQLELTDALLTGVALHSYFSYN